MNAFDKCLAEWDIPYAIAYGPAIKEELDKEEVAAVSFCFWLLFKWLPAQDHGPEVLLQGNRVKGLVYGAKLWIEEQRRVGGRSLLAQRRVIREHKEPLKLCLDPGTGVSALVRCDHAYGRLLEDDKPWGEVYAMFEREARIQYAGCPWLAEKCKYFERSLCQ